MTTFGPAMVAMLLSASADFDRATLEAPRLSPEWKVPVLHAGGLLLGMRLAVSVAWPQAYDPGRVSAEERQLKVAFTRPPEFHSGRSILSSDGDAWWLNTFGHGFFGSEVYGRARQCGGGPVGSILFTAGVSAAWEYGFEAPYKRPSAIDLVWTPLAGAALGEARFQLHRWLQSRQASGWLRFLVDPFGESERRFLGTRC